MTDGLVVVDKPAGMTSHDVVSRCRKIFGQKRVGHAGTLDPDATGVLLVGLGQATRLMQFMSGLGKSYDAKIVLGVATNTLDAAGEVTGEWDMSSVTPDQVREAAATLTGDLLQVPPMVSALKVGGKRLHALAREGIEIERKARPVRVERFDVVSQDGNLVDASIDCSSGTYVRVLAADLGTALGGGAHVRQLRRTAVGPWKLDDATGLDRLDESSVIPPAGCVPWLERIQVDADLATKVANGRVLDMDTLGASGQGPWSVVDRAERLLAVYQRHRSLEAKPVVVLANPS
ncbi:MAG TPA: tRNA pseudouridine(55) synthase TruB [Acidimicrobiales bacterium]|nr:tRNA pseudouridine(55) synthase TruB [Acidimicrobiales bacterium]